MIKCKWIFNEYFGVMSTDIDLDRNFYKTDYKSGYDFTAHG